MSAGEAQVFRWEDMPTDHPVEKLDRQRVVGEQSMIARVFLHQGLDVPTHSHENEQIACVMSGRVRFGLGAENSPERREVELGAGEVLLLPAWAPHSAFAVEDSLVLDVFSPPSEQTGVDRMSATSKLPGSRSGSRR